MHGVLPIGFGSIQESSATPLDGIGVPSHAVVTHGNAAEDGGVLAEHIGLNSSRFALLCTKPDLIYRRSY